MRPCRICKQPYEPRPYQLRSKVYTCLECLRPIQREKNRLRQQRRVERGLVTPREPRDTVPPNIETLRARWRRHFHAACKDRLRVRQITRNAILSGQLKRQPCEVCGSPDVHAHHDDYSRPLDVRWLCQPHHFELHGKGGRDACKHGHPYDEKNTGHYPSGSRYCRACRNNFSAAAHRKRRAALKQAAATASPIA